MTDVRAMLYNGVMQASLPDAAEELLAELTQWLRDEVAPVASSQVNWKVVINGRGTADWSFVLEKHGGRRRRCGDGNQTP